MSAEGLGQKKEGGPEFGEVARKLQEARNTFMEKMGEAHNEYRRTMVATLSLGAMADDITREREFLQENFPPGFVKDIETMRSIQLEISHKLNETSDLFDIDSPE